MARRTFDVVDVTEILIHWYAGRSKLELSASLGVDRKTIRKYVEPAEAEGLVPGGPPVTAAEWSEKVKKWFPQLHDTRLRQVTWPEIAKHHDYIKSMLAVVTMATIHQRLVSEHGLDVSVASLRRYVRANLPEENRRAQVTVLREDPPAGEEAQIDYGYLGSWVDPVSGLRRRVWAFVMVLACSRHMFVRPVLTMDQRSWTASHVAAFEFFGGVPRRLVPDNLKTGVDKPDLYDPKINRSYAELGVHYGTLIDPARAVKPKDKPRVERPMPYIRDSFWRGREFTSLPEMRAAAVDWCREVAGRRQCRPLGGAAPLSVFETTEAEALAALPTTPFVLATWSTAKVGPDIHAKVGRTLYSIPWRFLGATLDARETGSVVQFFHEGILVKTHPWLERGKRTDTTDYPPEKIAFQMRTPVWCRQRAVEIGEHCTSVITDLLAVNALFRLRAAQGVLGLATKHGQVRLEAACRRAIEVGDPSYRTIKGILAAGTENVGIGGGAERPSGDAGAAAFLHGPDELFANVVPLTTTGTASVIPTVTSAGDGGGSGDDGIIDVGASGASTAGTGEAS